MTKLQNVIAKKSECPTKGSYQVNDVVYKCCVTRPLPKNGSCMWHLESLSSETLNLTWSVLRCIPPYSNISKKCLLFLNQKLEIITYQNQKEVLNKRTELLCKYLYVQNSFLKKCIGNDFR